MLPPTAICQFEDHKMKNDDLKKYLKEIMENYNKYRKMYENAYREKFNEDEFHEWFTYMITKNN